MAEEQQKKKIKKKVKKKVRKVTSEGGESVDSSVGSVAESDSTERNVVDGISLDDLDKMIQQEDPKFLDSLKEITPELNTSQEIETLNIEGSIEAEKELNEKTSTKKNLIKILLSFLKNNKLTDKIIAFYRYLIWRITVLGITIFEGIKYYATDGRQQAIANIKSFIRARIDEVDDFFERVGRVSTVKKILFLLGIVFLGSFIYLGQKMYKEGHFLPTPRGLYLTSFHFVADQTYEYNPQTEVQPFYDAFRYTENVLQMSRVKVNLRPSTNSTLNPMGLFEFYIVGYSNDAVVEVKQRQVEMLDLIQRVLEGFTYDNLEGVQGKDVFKKVLIDEMNRVLSSGQIKDILIKTYVLKP